MEVISLISSASLSDNFNDANIAFVCSTLIRRSVSAVCQLERYGLFYCALDDHIWQIRTRSHISSVLLDPCGYDLSYAACSFFLFSFLVIVNF